MLRGKRSSNLYAVPSVVLRYFNVYGPREPLKGQYAPVIGLFKKQSLEKVPMTIVGSGNQKRDFTYIEDVVNANICAMLNMDSKNLFDIYNVGTGKNYSILEVSRLIGGEISHIPSRKAEAKYTLACIEKTRNDLSWNPLFSLEKMILSY